MAIRYHSRTEKVFDAANIAVLLGLAALTILPFLYVLAASFATESEIAARPFFLWPETATLDTYRYIFSTDTFIRSLLVTIGVTAVGTLVQITLTMLMAYPLSDPNLVGKGLIMRLVLFAMIFSGGMIPTFLVVKELGLLNSYWALILPTLLSAFNMLVVRNFFMQIPPELTDSARIDGASDLQVFLKIMLPLSKAVIAVIALFYAVGYWNNFFSALIYIQDTSKWPIQLVLNTYAVQGSPISQIENPNAAGSVTPQAIQMAIVVLATVPILCIYPFAQRFFTKGVLTGAIKG